MYCKRLTLILLPSAEYNVLGRTRILAFADPELQMVLVVTNYVYKDSTVDLRGVSKLSI